MMTRMDQLIRSAPWLFGFLVLLLNYAGDKILLTNVDKPIKAVCDTSIHGLIGFLTYLCIPWNLNVFERSDILVDGLQCLFVAMFIDLDHLVAARSFFLRDALNAPHRGYFHCSLILIALFILMMLPKLKDWTTLMAILMTAFLTHQLRDGLRRGLWFGPFGSTGPINYPIFLGTTMLYVGCTQMLFTARGVYSKLTNSSIV